jgi:Na+/H+-dicarboxylate symporter
MNKSGQTLGLSIISAVVVFIVGLTMLNFLMPEITDARVALNCADASAISDGTKLLCLSIDSVVPYWILLIFSITVGAIVGRFS